MSSWCMIFAQPVRANPDPLPRAGMANCWGSGSWRSMPPEEMVDGVAGANEGCHAPSRSGGPVPYPRQEAAAARDMIEDLANVAWREACVQRGGNVAFAELVPIPCLHRKSRSDSSRAFANGSATSPNRTLSMRARSPLGFRLRGPSHAAISTISQSVPVSDPPAAHTERRLHDLAAQPAARGVCSIIVDIDCFPKGDPISMRTATRSGIRIAGWIDQPSPGSGIMAPQFMIARSRRRKVGQRASCGPIAPPFHRSAVHRFH